jgi:hypothetical protein
VADFSTGDSYFATNEASAIAMTSSLPSTVAVCFASLAQVGVLADTPARCARAEPAKRLCERADSMLCSAAPALKFFSARPSEQIEDDMPAALPA